MAVTEPGDWIRVVTAFKCLYQQRWWAF